MNLDHHGGGNEHGMTGSRKLVTTGGKKLTPSLATAASSLQSQTRIDLNQGPIFVHSSFRTSSTWFWRKLRAAQHVTAYYEPFNETLSTLSRREAGSLSASSWASGHPNTAPYFLEYLSLLKDDGGMPSYDPSMAFDKFIPAEGLTGQISLEEKSYIDDLIRAAHESGNIPALACTRTLGRSSAIRRAYGGTSILLIRNIFHQWASYCGQAIAGNTYFLDTINRTVSASRHDLFIRDLDDCFSSRTLSVYDEHLFTMFIVLHLYLYAKSSESADIIVDTSSLQVSDEYRFEIEQKIKLMTGLDIELSDHRSSFDSSPINISDKKRFIDTIDHFSNMIKSQTTSITTAELVDKIKTEALEEWSRHEFYTHRSRVNRDLADKISHRKNELENLIIDAEERCAHLSREKDDLEKQLAEITRSQKAESAQWVQQKTELHHTLEMVKDENANVLIRSREMAHELNAIQARPFLQLLADRLQSRSLQETG